MTQPLIVGAGLAGLIAGHVFPRTNIVERAPRPEALHRALLRFRTCEVSHITGVPFREVTVRKGIWCDGQFHAPDIRLCNLYARKVTGALLDRSIWNLDPVQRFIAPDNLYEQLVEALGHRISWGTDAAAVVPEAVITGRTIITTAPMNEMAAIVERSMPEPIPKLPGVTFNRAPIGVQRFRIPGAAVHQTVYFPSPDTPFYRVSITGDLGIAEFMIGHDPEREFDMTVAFADTLLPFGLPPSEVIPLGVHQQRYGKIAPIDNRIRREFIHKLSTMLGIYSLGRFATWRNILLDDVVEDARVIKSMLENDSAYANQLFAVKRPT